MQTWQAMHLYTQMQKVEFSPGRENSTFSCWCLSSPNPFSQNFILRPRAILALFVLPLWQDFLKNGKLVLLPFFKNRSGSQNRSQHETLFSGLGRNLPTSKNGKSVARTDFPFFAFVYTNALLAKMLLPSPQRLDTSVCLR